MPTPDDAPELDKPTPSAETADEFSLVGQQLAFYRALAGQDERVAGWYLGARITLLNIENPERLQQAAHSLLPRHAFRPVTGLTRGPGRQSSSEGSSEQPEKTAYQCCRHHENSMYKRDW